MSVSDIRKVMVSSLLTDAGTYLSEIDQILTETKTFLFGHEHRSRFGKICHTVECLRLLSNTLEINLALNPKERFSSMSVKDLQALENIVVKLVNYNEQLKIIQNRTLEQAGSIKQMQTRLSSLSIDIDQYDDAVEKAVMEYNDKVNSKGCMIM